MTERERREREGERRARDREVGREGGGGRQGEGGREGETLDKASSGSCLIVFTVRERRRLSILARRCARCAADLAATNVDVDRRSGKLRVYGLV